MKILVYNKAEELGINVHMIKEDYTSKCSALDFESIKKHTKYLGKRIKRGLFRTASGLLINADINSGLNILRKAVGDVFSDQSIRGFVLNPIKINIS